MMKFEPIERACELAGGLTALAHMLGVAPPTVHQWLTFVRPVPPGRCRKIEEITNKEVTRQMLRPDDWEMYWSDLTPPS